MLGPHAGGVQVGAGLRTARTERGWSQERLIHEVERYARHHLMDIASTASLRVYVSEWENGRRPLSEQYAVILRALLGVTNAELFGDPEQLRSTEPVHGYAELLNCIDSARNVSSTMVETLMQQTELLRTMDRQMGAAALVDQMSGHLSALEEALTFAVLPDIRRPIALALAGAATLAAWQALDVGAVQRAWRNYELGKRAAQEAGEPMYLAHAMAEQAYIVCEAGRSEMALSLIQGAQRAVNGKASPRLRAWLFAVESELHANTGNTDECRRSLDLAATYLPDGDEARDPDMLSIFLNRGHLARWRGHVLAMLGDDDAVDSLYEALRTMDRTFVRASSGLHLDLATAHLSREENPQAREHLRCARRVVNRTGSVRHHRRIEQLKGKL